MGAATMAEPPVTLSEAQAYVRVETGEEEAVLAGLLRTATGLCEAFLGQVVMARSFTATVKADSCWQRIALTPVRAIEAVSAVAADGTTVPLSPSAYAVDIDSDGDGWVRLVGPAGEGRVEVSGTAGMAAQGDDVPEPVRQGVLRLVAHLFNARDGSGGEVPAAVTALWRPYRRMRLA